jgi:hypothetical protein
MDRDSTQPPWLKQAVEKLQKASQERGKGASGSEDGLDSVKLHKALLEAGVGRHHAIMLSSHTALLQTSALKAVHAFASDSTSWCLVLAGSRGAGKTLAAEWLLARAFRSETSGRARARHVYTSLQVMRARRDERLLEAMSSLEPLILDDLGVEVPDRTGDFLWCLFEVVNQRWRNRKRTLITTNVAPAEFHRRYGERVTERIQDDGRCVVVKGISLRRPPATF